MRWNILIIIENSAININDSRLKLSNYTDELNKMFRDYISQKIFDSSYYSNKANQKAEEIFKMVIYRNDKTILSYPPSAGENLLGISIGKKTSNLIKLYSTCIMLTLGKLAECVVIDECKSNLDYNIILINIALLKKGNVFEKIVDFPYNDYVAFSPSHKYLFYLENGVLILKKVPDRNANHETKDIGWCKKENTASQLRVNIPELDYIGNAKIQVKVSLAPSKLILDKYYSTPVIVFNLSGDDTEIEDLLDKYPYHAIFDAKNIVPEMAQKVENYFRVLISEVFKYDSHLNINEHVINDEELEYLFRTPVNKLIENEQFSFSGIIELIKKHGKAIEIST